MVPWHLVQMAVKTLKMVMKQAWQLLPIWIEYDEIIGCFPQRLCEHIESCFQIIIRLSWSLEVVVIIDFKIIFWQSGFINSLFALFANNHIAHCADDDAMGCYSLLVGGDVVMMCREKTRRWWYWWASIIKNNFKIYILHPTSSQLSHERDGRDAVITISLWLWLWLL